MPVAAGLGAGRWGWLEEPLTLAELGRRLKDFLHVEHLQTVGDPGRSIRTLAVACGAADELLAAAQAGGCDAMLIGEARFHTCLEAEATQIALLLARPFRQRTLCCGMSCRDIIETIPPIKNLGQPPRARSHAMDVKTYERKRMKHEG